MDEHASCHEILTRVRLLVDEEGRLTVESGVGQFGAGRRGRTANAEAIGKRESGSRPFSASTSTHTGFPFPLIRLLTRVYLLQITNQDISHQHLIWVRLLFHSISTIHRHPSMVARRALLIV
jgi:hypothetical protein